MSIVISPIEQRKGELIQAARDLIAIYKDYGGCGDVAAQIQLEGELDRLEICLTKFDTALFKEHKEQNRKDKHAKKR